MPGTSTPTVRSPSPGISKSGAPAVPMMATGSIGARDKDGTQGSVLDWPCCSSSNEGAVPPVGCSSTLRIGLKLIISMAIAAMHARRTSKRCMDTATMRRRGSMGTISRTVCVTSIRTLRSGVLGNGHAPFWNSGRWSDPPLDCNIYWTPEGRRLAFAWVVILENKGEATGLVEIARAHVESVSPGTTQGVKQPLDDIQVSEKGDPSHPLSFSMRSADTHDLEITMASQLTPEVEQAFVKEGLYALVLEVDVPQPKYRMYCIYLGPSVVKDLRENGYGKL